MPDVPDEWTATSMRAAVENGQILAEFSGGTTEKVVKFLAAMGDLLLESVLDENGDPGPNYASAEVTVGRRVIFISAIDCWPGRRTGSGWPQRPGPPTSRTGCAPR